MGFHGHQVTKDSLRSLACQIAEAMRRREHATSVCTLLIHLYRSMHIIGNESPSKCRWHSLTERARVFDVGQPILEVSYPA